MFPPHDKTVRLAPSKRSAIEAFVVMDIMREASARERLGEGIIHMEVGQPGTPAPRLVREAAKRAIDADPLGYTDALGLASLRERIARYYEEEWAVRVDPARIVVTTGSSAGFLLAFLAVLDEGDGIALLEPSYPCYRQIAKLLGLTPVFIEAREPGSFRPKPADIDRALGSANALIIASPANPTGVVMGPGELSALIARTQAVGAWFISDEIYHGLTYGRQAATAAQFSDDAIIINSFSKYYSMTGWRIGWMVVPVHLARTVERLAQNLYISPPAISQHAAVAAFEARDELESYKATYAKNRAMLLEELPRAGFEALAPADGAFYLYADVSKFTADSAAFVRRMLQEIGVAATPGTDFDERAGRSFVRFSYSGTFENMAEAARRLKEWKK